MDRSSPPGAPSRAAAAQASAVVSQHARARRIPRGSDYLRPEPSRGLCAVQSVRLVVTTDHGSRINFRGHGGSTACLRKKVSKVGKQLRRLISFSC
jgi:hypothetical protein